jgi:hypothetical protein
VMFHSKVESLVVEGCFSWCPTGGSASARLGYLPTEASQLMLAKPNEGS